MAYARILARLVSNLGLQDYNFDGINDMPLTSLLSVQIAECQQVDHLCRVTYPAPLSMVDA